MRGSCKRFENGGAAIRRGAVIVSLMASVLATAPVTAAHADPAAGTDHAEVCASDGRPSVGRIPPMAFNTYYAFGADYNSSTIDGVADAMVKKGLKAAGYNYLNIDGGWWNYGSPRDAKGNLQVDTSKFPNGMRPVADYIHSKGLKFGIYLQPTEQLDTSEGHTTQDAKTIASWGTDFLKYDGYGTPGNSPAFTAMRDALCRTGRRIFYSINTAEHNPHPDVANMWRTHGDIARMDGYVTWSGDWCGGWCGSVTANLDANAQFSAAAGPNHWNDPDMLLAGDPQLTSTEQRSQFSMWAVMAAPLIFGSDPRTMTPETLRILTNREVIKIDQDRLGKQGTLLSEESPGLEVWRKPLSNGDVGVALFNETDQAARISTTADQVGIQAHGSGVTVRNLWSHRQWFSSSGKLSATVPAHGTVLYRVRVN